ncbi:MAG: large-conductance mechanosensitive channel protein MscL [Bacteroidales bacterium]|nr:large-conductance mechanosensitive channel protein MscL [Bacteroidales bacterium]
MKFFKEFREFASKGNVIDLAVGIIIGAAFGKIVSSLVNDIIMPPIGLIIGGVDFTDLKIILKEAAIGANGEPIQAVSINYGSFVQVLIDFLIIAFAIFLLVKSLNKMKKKEIPQIVTPPAPSKEEILLTEIRDVLKSKT